MSKIYSNTNYQHSIILGRKFFETGIHLGNKTKFWNPKMAPYLLCEKNGFHVFDILKIFKFLKLTSHLLTKKQFSEILIVGTTKIGGLYAKKFAEKGGIHYINHRWLGGTLTNWSTVKKQIFQENENLFFQGLRNLKTLPDLVIFTNQKKEKLAIEECKKLGIPNICLIDSNNDPDINPFIIPVNIDSSSAICLILNFLILSFLNKKNLERKKNFVDAKQKILSSQHLKEKLLKNYLTKKN